MFFCNSVDLCWNIKTALKARINSIAGTGEILKRDGASKMDGFRNPIIKVASGKMADGRNAAIEIVLRILEL